MIISDELQEKHREINMPVKLPILCIKHAVSSPNIFS